jgi:sterol desaturase/sphingolipid hydroxylase (fatty acid hydroxylase superfamily)
MHKKLMNSFIYPMVVSLAVGLYAFSSSHGSSLPLSAFGSVMLGAMLIAVLEQLSPHQMKWRPRIQDLKDDLLYIALIQIVMPRLLGFLVVLLLANQIGQATPFPGIWPHEWSIPAQALLLIISADFMRYWLHRLSHATPLLWRLHAVHHSTDRLYWLNTSRFHPIEKALQFMLDSLPFILMGVDPHVIGFWFVLYSVNGFFQHSNIRLNFGFLSGIFSTAELHRWHHSQIPAESNSNYANVFILWDRLLGTYYRPVGEVGTLGLLNPDYPMGIVEQMKAPFVAELYSQNVSQPKTEND